MLVSSLCGAISVLQIRQMILSDVAFATRLVETVGWNQLAGDWQRLLTISPEGCFVVEQNRRPAATATATAYGTECGWVGMVLVHPDNRRQGIGAAMIHQCLNYLTSLGVRTIKLDATDEGRAVYLKHGFVDEYSTVRLAGTLHLHGYRQDRYELRPIRPGDWPAVTQMDRVAFGADRSELLAVLARAQPDLAMIAMEDDRLAGYGFARPGRLHGYIGPVVAERPDAAEALVAALNSRLDAATVLVDTTALNAAWLDWLETNGLQVQRRLTRMYFGTNDCPGEPNRVYTLSAFETG